LDRNKAPFILADMTRDRGDRSGSSPSACLSYSSGSWDNPWST